MSLAQLKDQATHLNPADLYEFIAFLIARQTAQDKELQRELARKIDDDDPAHWVELEEVLKHYPE